MKISQENSRFPKGLFYNRPSASSKPIIEKANEYNLPRIGFIDYEKAFDTVEHFAIFEALRKTNTNETYINILQTSTAKQQQGFI